MTALDYDMLADLCNRKLGMHDVACPLCGPSRRSPVNRKRQVLRIWHREPGFASYCCQRCGAQGYARANGVEGHHQHLHRSDDGVGEDHAARQRQKAKGLWSRREPVVASPAEVYLRQVRGYGGPLLATLGFLPPTRPDHHPALIAAFGIAVEIEPGVIKIDNGQVQGVHLTFLKPNGSGKAGTERDKIMVGSSLGFPIVLAPMNDLLGLAITEGIEDALTIHDATGLGAWAAGSASRIPALAKIIPGYCDAVTVAADDDGTGSKAAAAFCEAIATRGISANLVLPYRRAA